MNPAIAISKALLKSAWRSGSGIKLFSKVGMRAFLRHLSQLWHLISVACTYIRRLSSHQAFFRTEL